MPFRFAESRTPEEVALQQKRLTEAKLKVWVHGIVPSTMERVYQGFETELDAKEWAAGQAGLIVEAFEHRR